MGNGEIRQSQALHSATHTILRPSRGVIERGRRLELGRTPYGRAWLRILAVSDDSAYCYQMHYLLSRIRRTYSPPTSDRAYFALAFALPPYARSCVPPLFHIVPDSAAFRTARALTRITLSLYSTHIWHLSLVRPRARLGRDVFPSGSRHSHPRSGARPMDRRNRWTGTSLLPSSSLECECV